MMVLYVKDRHGMILSKIVERAYETTARWLLSTLAAKVKLA